MELGLVDISEEPLYLQIKTKILQKILSGELKNEETLPSIRELARTNGISVITVQKAYDELLHADLIFSRRGMGYFVRQISKQERNLRATENLQRGLRKQLSETLKEGLSGNEVRLIFEQIIAELTTFKGKV